MRKLFKFKADFIENNFPDCIYSENLDDSIVKWIRFITENSSLSQFYAELSSIVNDSFNPTIEKVEGTPNFFQVSFNSISETREVFIEEIDITPDFIAKLKYLSVEDGGRNGFAHIGYRPLVKFPFSEYYTSGEQIFLDRDNVFPGEEVKAQIRIFDKITFNRSLVVGMEFEFCEFPNKPVGIGQILEILNKKLIKANY